MQPASPADGFRIRVAPTYAALSRQAADFVCAELKNRPDLLLCAAAGGSPAGAYAMLASRRARAPSRFKRLRVIQIDEWVGLPAGHPATCDADLRRNLVEPLRISPNRYVGFRTEARAPGSECGRITSWLRQHGPIDVCVLGIGLNGHVAMNEPGEIMIPDAHVATLARSSKRHPLLKDLAKKPRYGLTLGMGDILLSRRILLLVSGQRKRPALARLLRSRVTPRFPASLLRLHRDVTVLCDREAVGDLLEGLGTGSATE